MVRLFADLQTPLPEFKKFLSAGSVTNFLNGAEVNVEGFHSVWQTLQAANSLFSPQLKPLAHAVLPAVETEVGSQFKAVPLSKSFRYGFVNMTLWSPAAYLFRAPTGVLNR